MSDFKCCDIKNEIKEELKRRWSHKSWNPDSLPILLLKEAYIINKNECYFCKRKKLNGEYDIEHLLSRYMYPNYQYHYNNLIIACRLCNGFKSSIDILDKGDFITLDVSGYPNRSEFFKIIHPYFDNYNEHIEIMNDIFFISKSGSSKGLNTIQYYGLSKLAFIEALYGSDRDAYLNGDYIMKFPEYRDFCNFIIDIKIEAAIYSVYDVYRPILSELFGRYLKADHLSFVAKIQEEIFQFLCNYVIDNELDNYDSILEYIETSNFELDMYSKVYQDPEINRYRQIFFAN